MHTRDGRSVFLQDPEIQLLAPTEGSKPGGSVPLWGGVPRLLSLEAVQPPFILKI